jgi:hypothetical protein
VLAFEIEVTGVRKFPESFRGGDSSEARSDTREYSDANEWNAYECERLHLRESRRKIIEEISLRL